MPRRTFPEQLRTDLASLATLLDTLTKHYLEEQAAPFAAPPEVYAALARLKFVRMHGAGRSQGTGHNNSGQVTVLSERLT